MQRGGDPGEDREPERTDEIRGEISGIEVDVERAQEDRRATLTELPERVVSRPSPRCAR